MSPLRSPRHSRGRGVPRLLLLPWLCFPQLSVTIQRAIITLPVSPRPPCHRRPARCVLTRVAVTEPELSPSSPRAGSAALGQPRPRCWIQTCPGDTGGLHGRAGNTKLLCWHTHSVPGRAVLPGVTPRASLCPDGSARPARDPRPGGSSEQPGRALRAFCCFSLGAF